MKFDERVAYALIRAAKLYLRISSAGLAELGLQQGQDILLRYLWERDGLAQADLVTCLSVEPPTVTKMLARLERAGFVTRKKDPERPKQWRVYLTAKGRKAEGDVKAHWDKMEARATARLSTKERATFRELALKVREGLASDG
jgi:DNA-binding MarR family transcriptional regulator